MFGRKDGEMTHRLWRVTCWGPCRADASWPWTCVGPLCPLSERGPVCAHSPAAHTRRSHQRLCHILLHPYPTLGKCCIYSYKIKLPDVHKKCLGRGITALPQVGSQISSAVCTRQPLKSSTRENLDGSFVTCAAAWKMLPGCTPRAPSPMTSFEPGVG